MQSSPSIKYLLIPLILIVFGIISVLSLMAFQTEPEEPKTAMQLFIDQKVAERLDLYRNRRLEQCKIDALERASEIVDSLLVLEARNSRDTLSKPPKPGRPVRPEIKTVLDSTPIAPFLNVDSLRNLEEN